MAERINKYVRLVPTPLLDAFSVETGRRLAFIGAGGKSTTIGRIAKRAADRNPPVAVSTTTKMQFDQAVGPVWSASDHPWRSPPAVFTMAEILKSNNGPTKLSSPNEDALSELLNRFPGRVLIEADGARRARLKIHRDFEPVVPESIDALVSLFDLSVVGEPAIEDNVHALEIWKEWFQDLDRITPESIEAIFREDPGYQPPDHAEQWLAMTHPGENREELVDTLKSFSKDFWESFDRVVLLQNQNIFRAYFTNQPRDEIS